MTRVAASSTTLFLVQSGVYERGVFVCLDKLQGVPTCQRSRRWPSDVTAVLFFLLVCVREYVYIVYACVCARVYVGVRERARERESLLERAREREVEKAIARASARTH